MEYNEINSEIEKLESKIRELKIERANIDEQNNFRISEFNIEKKDNCVMCGKMGEQGHHLFPDYLRGRSVAIPVVWLCCGCHVRIHVFYNNHLDMIEENKQKDEIEGLANDIYILQYIRKALDYIESFSQSP